MAAKMQRGGISGLVRLAAPHKGKMIFSGLLAVIGQGCGLVPFFLVYLIIAEISSKPLASIDQQFVYLLVAGGVAAVVGKQVCLGLSTALSHIAAYKILYDIRLNLADKLKRLPLGYFNRSNTGQIKKVISEDVEQMEIFLAHNIPDFVGAVVYLILTTLVLFIVDWRLALATVVVLPGGFVLQMINMGRGRVMLGEWIAATESMNAAIIEYIQGMPIIKAFNHTVTSFSKYATRIEKCSDLESDWTRRWSVPSAVFSVSIYGNMLLLLPVGAFLYLTGAVTLETFVFFLLLGIGFGNPVWLLVQFGRIMERNLACLSQINLILDEPEIIEPKLPQEPGRGISGKEVTFSYDTRNMVLDGIDFAIPDARFTALVGPSGAGKTTLARLIPRFWDVSRGAISLGETDIRLVPTEALLERFGLIFQHVHLFNDSVLANLRMGSPTAPDEEIIAAAKTARCHDFVMNLPQGYNTVIGEKGARISGGEKQRLSIARALLRDAPILILDEATAFIDPENEALVQEAINQLIRNKTLIVIAHRLSTIIAADEILVLDKGRIAARGNHQALLKDSQLYRRMWDSHISAQGWGV